MSTSSPSQGKGPGNEVDNVYGAVRFASTQAHIFVLFNLSLTCTVKYETSVFSDFARCRNSRIELLKNGH